MSDGPVRSSRRLLEESGATLRWFGRDLPLSMLAVSFTPGHEVHPIPGPAPSPGISCAASPRLSCTASPRLALVEGFADTPFDAVPGFRGRLLSERDADAVWAAVVATTTRGAAVVSGEVHLPTLELADGDPWRVPLAWWPFAAALVSARDDRTGGRHYWDRPRVALAAFQDSLAPERLHVMLHVMRDAAALTDEALRGIVRSHEQRYGEAPPLDQLRAVRTFLNSKSAVGVSGAKCPDRILPEDRNQA